MKYRQYGKIAFSEIGIGTYGLSGVYGPKDHLEFKDLIRRGYELGVNFFDTAKGYGEAEVVLGEAVRDFRKDIILASKAGRELRGIREDCEASLQSLGTDYLDLYQVHYADSVPIEETVGILEELKLEGKIREYGVSHLPFEKIKEFFDKGNIFSVLMEYSAVARNDDLLSWCQDRNVAVIAFSITGRGLLTGKYTSDFGSNDIRNIDPLFQKDRLESGLRVAAKFTEIGQRYGKSSVQVAIKWVLSKGFASVLTGPGSIEHLEENLAVNWELDDLEEIEVFLKEEQQWLENSSRKEVTRILHGELDEETGFTDLVYVLEAAIILGMTSEERIIPLFEELFALRNKPDLVLMKRIQRDFVEILKL